MIALAIITGCAIVTAIATALAARRIYLIGHRAGFAAGRSEGYRSGVTRGHAAGVDQAAQLAHRLGEDHHVLAAWRERFESPE